ncbi:MAG: hypothetical protein BRD44_04030 [Bacteroidetes bacterium QS_7_67_15]|nr:MAG: hypothetical protein BRD37_05635 [Bacteroidetes bacterium QH_8_67_23]PSQ83586.1 MAG: hypothetical protein BRD44_04030 [Bacteroidetes bacterium QS_7_67_15]PSQ85341.1 MAG: hypothetical protein BRD30_10750 [Bacteroidetes bacterium QH_2_63_10]
MKAKIGKWGNSLAVRLPKPLAEEVCLSEGATAEIRVEKGRLLIEPSAQNYDLDALLEGITEENRHAEIFSGPSVGGEAW